MNILEQELEELVWSAMTTNVMQLYDRGLYCCDKYDTYVRQFDLCEYGRADIVGFRAMKSHYGERSILVKIFELKKEKVGLSTLMQAVRYAKGIQEKFDHEGKKYNLEFQYILIGKTAELDGDFIYMADVFENVDIYTIGIDLVDGVRFKRIYDYSLTNSGFRKGTNDLGPILKRNVKQVFQIRKSFEESDDLPF